MSRALNDGEFPLHGPPGVSVALNGTRGHQALYSAAARPIPADRFYSRATPEQIARFSLPPIQVRQKADQPAGRYFWPAVRASSVRFLPLVHNNDDSRYAENVVSTRPRPQLLPSRGPVASSNPRTSKSRVRIRPRVRRPLETFTSPPSRSLENLNENGFRENPATEEWIVLWP